MMEVNVKGVWLASRAALPTLRDGASIVNVSSGTVLRGSPGSDVELRVRRPGVEGLLSFTVTRERIQLRSVPFVTEVSEDIGYVPLQLMSESSSEEVRQAVDSLREAGMRGLIFDLRSNPGGLLDQGVGVTDLFLPSGETVVETRGRASGQNQVFDTSDPAAYEGLRVVVLVDGHSASASEIVAGALQDHDRALIVGAPSFGKGSVQTLYRLTGGNVLKLTTARWYTPSGRSIEKEDRSEQQPGGETLDDLNGVLTLQGNVVQRPDTTDRPTFQTQAGRTVFGGGGITPDVLVMADTLERDEEDAVRDLFRTGGTFWTAVFNYSVEYLRENPDPERGFSLSDADVERFYGTLAELDAEVDRAPAADRFVRFQLEKEIANQAWGRIGEFRQTLETDRQLQRALELLERSDTQASLFEAAGSPLPGRAEEETASSSAAGSAGGG